MREVPKYFDTVWQNGDFTGPRKATRRVTLQRPKMRLDAFELMTTFKRVPAVYGEDVTSFNPYPTGIDPNHGERVTNTYADFLFTSPAAPLELPNVISVSWSRSTDVDTASVTVELWNNVASSITAARGKRGIDNPGFLSPGRGTSPFSTRWDHHQNPYTGLLMPDNLMRTYEGWGSDNPDDVAIGAPGYVPPERDSKVLQTGLWLIDKIDLSALGRITISGRDPGRLLLDHQSMLPVVPDDFHPVTFRDWSDKVTVAERHKEKATVKAVDRLKIWHEGSGNDLWPESAYVGAKVYGHSSKDAFDGKRSTYFLSVGNARASYRSAFEYVDIGVKGTISEVRFRTVKDGYNAFVSLKVGGEWVDGRSMPYHRDGRGKYEEGVPYVAYKGGLSGEGEHVIKLGTRKNVTMVRLWLGNLPSFGLPGQKYRAGIREVELWGPTTKTVKKTVTESSQVGLKAGPAGSNPGRCEDYTDIIKLFCAWAGLYWPRGGYLWHSDGTKRACSPATVDHVLGKGVPGRVWGDFQATGTAPVEEIATSAFDQKSLMDGVRYVAEAIGFNFWFDETGAAQWRLPNIWDRGNWIGGLSSKPGRTTAAITIDESRTLLDLSTSLQSTNVREGIFVANPVGKFAAMVPGYNPNDTGLRRVGGWTDQHFASVEEATVTADLIAVRQMFRYRQDRLSIPAHPAIQIDDQVRVFEQVTSEGYYHYVSGISSSNSADSGQWTYTLQTHWLGDDPDGAWAFDKSSLTSNTLQAVDALQGGVEFSRAGKEI